MSFQMSCVPSWMIVLSTVNFILAVFTCDWYNHTCLLACVCACTCMVCVHVYIMCVHSSGFHTGGWETHFGKNFIGKGQISNYVGRLFFFLREGRGDAPNPVLR